MALDDLQKFKAIYIEECRELLNDMEELLVSAQVDTNDKETLNAIFRCAHSIKGGAGAFSLTRLAGFTHTMESLLDELRDGTISLSQEIIDNLLEAKDVLLELIDSAEKGVEPEANLGTKVEEELKSFSSLTASSVTTKLEEVTTVANKSDEVDKSKLYSIKFTPHENLFRTGNDPVLIFKELRALGKLSVCANTSRIPPFDQLDPEACYINYELGLESTARPERIKEAFEFVDDVADILYEEVAGIFNEYVEPIKEAVNSNNKTTEKKTDTAKADDTKAAASSAASASSIRVDVDKIDKLVNLVGELVITQAMIKAQIKDVPYEKFAQLINGVDSLSQYTRELQDAVMSVRMQPIKNIFSRMPRMVRDLSRKLNKEINLDVKGEGTEIDKTIIEQLSDPLVHLIRNSADHGIEAPDTRVEMGKPKVGTIQLIADQRGDKIVISIIDDGAGINREKVLEKAIQKGVVSEEDAPSYTNEMIDQLIFAAGFSTAQSVTDVSGRGVGMDVVKKNIEAIGGFIQIHNDPGHGLAIEIFIPLTLAILDGMIVRIGSENYIIPINVISETLKPKSEDLKKIGEGNDLIQVRDQFISLVPLHNLFAIHGAELNILNSLVVIVENNKQKYGLIVDELVGQQQVVIKSLNEDCKSVDGISGATILGDGSVALILEVTKLVNVYQKNQQTMGIAV